MPDEWKFCKFEACIKRGRRCMACRGLRKIVRKPKVRKPPGRKVNDALAIAKLCGDREYEGSPCKKCGATLKYTSNQGCIACARNRSVEGTQLRNAAAVLNQPTDESVDKPEEPEQYLSEDQMSNPWD